MAGAAETHQPYSSTVSWLGGSISITCVTACIQPTALIILRSLCHWCRDGGWVGRRQSFTAVKLRLIAVIIVRGRARRPAPSLPFSRTQKVPLITTFHHESISTQLQVCVAVTFVKTTIWIPLVHSTSFDMSCPCSICVRREGWL